MSHHSVSGRATKLNCSEETKCKTVSNFQTILICSHERQFFKNHRKTDLHVPTNRWFLKWPKDINAINSSHVETVVLMCASSEAGKC